MSITRPRRLLIVTGNLSLLQGHYDPVIVGLARAGVEVSIRYIKEKQLDPAEYAASLAAAAGVEVPVRKVARDKRGPADRLALRLRELGNTLRYTHPDYSGRTVLSERSLEKIDPGVRRWSRRIRRLDPRLGARVAGAAGWLESGLPAAREARELLAEEKPDAVAIVPVIRIPRLVDFTKAGAETGVATTIWVQSWDNLTNKGLLHFVPDRVFVWNKSQEQELARYHGVPPSHVCITGAQTFDHWFEDSTIPERTQFCAQLGVSPEEPIILYLASSRQIAPEEPPFFARWLRALRSSDDPSLRTATVLVRPHPTLVEAWHSHGFDREPGVAVSPSLRESRMNSREFRERYRAELHHASLAVGVNTSGFIDAAIFGKPACTVELPELFRGQRGTVHFELLARENGGLLRVATSLDEHVAELSALVRRDAYAVDERSRAFVGEFVRPHGLDVSPTEVFVREMRALCESPPTIAAGGLRRLVGTLVARTAWLVGAPLEEKPFASMRSELGRASAKSTGRVLRLTDSKSSTRRALRRRARGAVRRLTRLG
ncbi:MAG: hypothetical protein QOI27_1289 [Gaiellaceae bacterium]|nr:hypothetical protein [Gaiellaceae bacterium]